MRHNLLLAMMLGMFATPALADRFKDCTQLASDLNAMTPMNVDKISVWKSTVCVRMDKNVVLTYVYTLDVASGAFNQAKLETLRATQLQSWCTNPQQKALFDLYVVNYKYYDKAGKYIGELTHDKTQCK